MLFPPAQKREGGMVLMGGRLSLIWSHTGRPRCFPLWTHGSAWVYAKYKCKLLAGSGLVIAPGLLHVGGHGPASPSPQTATLPKFSEEIGASSRASGLPRAWASRAIFATGSTCCGLAIDHGSNACLPRRIHTFNDFRDRCGCPTGTRAALGSFTAVACKRLRTSRPRG